MSQIKENAAGQSRFPLNEAEKEWLHKEEEKAGKNRPVSRPEFTAQEPGHPLYQYEIRHG